MPNYGDVKYWDKRYEDEKDSPFDWLFDFSELDRILKTLLPDKNENILLIGCGNAPFSSDLHTIGGYKNILNTDLSAVVIMQQSKKYPCQQWKVLDATHMDEISDKSIPVVIDKSLIDTLMCCSNSEDHISQMIDEIYRVLSPGSRLITFSLHPVNEVVCKYDIPTRFHWKVTYFRVKSSRWNDTTNRKRAVSHTMIICDKPIAGEYPRPLSLLENHVPGILSEEEDSDLKKTAEDVLFRHALKVADIFTLRRCLYNALQRVRKDQQDESSRIQVPPTVLKDKKILNKMVKVEKL